MPPDTTSPGSKGAKEIRVHGRGGQGVISIQTNERNGPVIGAILATDSDELMLISNAGTFAPERWRKFDYASMLHTYELLSSDGGRSVDGFDDLDDHD